jgi:hypothetical protein
MFDPMALVHNDTFLNQEPWFDHKVNKVQHLEQEQEQKQEQKQEQQQKQEQEQQQV